MILSILQGPTDYYQYIYIDVKRRYNESDHFFVYFLKERVYERLSQAWNYTPIVITYVGEAYAKRAFFQ